jgi:hypothetical protein
MLPVLLFFVNKRLVKLPAGGSALGDFIAVNVLALRKAGIRGFGRKGYWDRVKPSIMAAQGDTQVVQWDDQFVEDVRRTMGACAISSSSPYNKSTMVASVPLLTPNLPP